MDQKYADGRQDSDKYPTNVDRRRMDDLREELCLQKCPMGRLVKGRLKILGMRRAWMKTAYQGWLMCISRRRGRPPTRDDICAPIIGEKEERKATMRWLDCIPRDTKKAEVEDEDWMTVDQDTRLGEQSTTTDGTMYHPHT